MKYHLAQINISKAQDSMASKTMKGFADRLDEISKSILDSANNITLLPFSNLTAFNVDTIKSMLSPGKTYCLPGSSDVGKTTLINSILGNTRFKTQPVSKIGDKGKHTTTSRELIQLQSGAMVIDTPGMRELGNMSVDTGLTETYTC